jgi:zinc protease
MASLVLGYGESSRLHQLLVRDKSLVQGVSAGTEDRRGPDIFSVDAKLSEGAKVGDVEKLIEAEVKKLGAAGPSDAELEKVRRQVQAGFVLGLQSNMARAKKLGEYETYFGDARLLNEELPRYLAVSKDDIKRVVTQYLGPTRRTIVETYPTADEPKADAPKAEAPKGDVKPAALKDAKAADTKKAKGAAATATKKAGAAKDAKPKKKK